MSRASPGSTKTLVTRSMASWEPVVTMISLWGSASMSASAMNLESSPLSESMPVVFPYWSISIHASGVASSKILQTSAPGREGGS